MVLATFMLPAGYHKDSWRVDGNRVDEWGSLDFVLELTQMVEAAKLDAVFLGEVVHANTLPRPGPATRYRWATEFVDVGRQPWESWDGGAITNDWQSGEYLDRSRLRRIDLRASSVRSKDR